MRMITPPRVATALLALALALPAAAWAQTSTTNPAPAPAPAATKVLPSRRDNVEQRIADMHATLRITAAQEARFNEFAQVMLDNAQAMDALLTKNADGVATQNAPQILQAYSMVAQQHAQDVQKLSTAFGTLYAALTPEQQKAADEMFRSSTLRHDEKHSG